MCVLIDADFKRAVDVQRDIFNVMLEAIRKNIRYFGLPPKLSRADQLLMTLMCWHEYRTEFHIGVSYGISESATCRTTKKIENALIESEIFHLSGGKSVSCHSDLKTVLIDASEQPVERPKNSQLNYSGKKKCFTQKVQTVVDFEAGEILSSDFCHGRTHDFRLFKESGAAVQPHVLILADAGCSGDCKNSQKQQNSVQKEKELSFERRGKEGERRPLKTADSS